MNGPRHTQRALLRGCVAATSVGSAGIGADLVRAVAADGAKLAFHGTTPDGGQPLTSDALATGLVAPGQADCDIRDACRA